MEESTAPRIDSLLREGNNTLRIVKSLEPGLGLQLNTPYRFGKDVNAYRKAADAHDGARTLRIKTLSPEQRRLDREAKTLISKTKNILKPELGPVWNERWTDAGFLDTSIQSPEDVERPDHLAATAWDLLKDHPQFEMEKFGVTAGNAETLHAALTKIGATLEKQVTIEAELSRARKIARKALERRLAGLRHELKQLLADDDARWRTLGYVFADHREARRLKAKAKEEAKGKEEPKASTGRATTAAPASTNGAAALNG